MIKNLLWATSSIALMTGCASTPTTKNPNIGLQGLLICQTNEICPIVTIAWNESFKDSLKVKMSLNSAYQKYNIQKVTLTNGEKSHTFNVTGPTAHDYVFGSYRSRNNIMVPVNLMADFSGSQKISMNIHTDQGVISRYILKDNLKAPIFEELSKAYK